MDENKIPPFKERTFIQHIGRLIEVVVAIATVIGTSGILNKLTRNPIFNKNFWILN